MSTATSTSTGATPSIMLADIVRLKRQLEALRPQRKWLLISPNGAVYAANSTKEFLSIILQNVNFDEILSYPTVQTPEADARPSEKM